MKTSCAIVGIAVTAASTLWAATNTTCDTLNVIGTQAQGGGIASGTNATAEGRQSMAVGAYTHAEGSSTLASGRASHAEGVNSMALGVGSHAEGISCIASSTASHAEGSYTIAGGSATHTEGSFTEAYASFSHAGGVFARVRNGHRASFIHATGTAVNIKESLYPGTAHFDRMMLFENANDDPRSVLTRTQNDARYATSAQGVKADAALKPHSPWATLVVSNLQIRGAISANHPAIASNDVVRKGEMEAAIEKSISARLPEFCQIADVQGESTYSIRENLTCSLGELAFSSYAGGYVTKAYNYFSWAGGRNSEAMHEGSFIFAAGDETHTKTTHARYTAHFDRLHTFEKANDFSNSVLNRGECDARYVRVAYLAPQGDLGMGIYTNRPAP